MARVADGRRRWRARVWGRFGLGLILPWIALAFPVAAQHPGAQRGRFEIPGMDWGPTAAWRVRASLVRQTRWNLLRQGDLRTLNSVRPLGAPTAFARPLTSATAVSGTFYVPVIPIAFSDKTVDYPVSDFQNVLFATSPPFGRPYSVKTFYEEISHGRIQMFGKVLDPVRTDSVAAYYQQNCNGIGVTTSCPDGGRRFGLMLLAVLDSISNRADSGTVWAQYDNDGPDGIPNSGDDDGLVDFVTFLQPVKDGACDGPGIWAHRFVISFWNGGSSFVTKTPRRNAQGQVIPGQFIQVENYTIQSQVGGSNGCDATNIMPIGTVAHETGHAFGLPDLYDTDRNSGTEGAGEWSLMASGNYTKSYSPTGFDAWSLNELGWAVVDTLGTTRMVTTGPRQLTDTVFLAPTTSASEFVLIENRQAVFSDTAMLDQNLSNLPTCKSRCRKAPGLLVWHIDLNRISQGRINNSINTGQVQGVALEQSDGLNQLRTRGGNRGDAGDPFPGAGGSAKYGFHTAPASVTNTGQYDGFIIDQIAQLPAQVVQFRFLRREPTVVSSTLFGATVKVNGQFTSRFEDVVPSGDQLAISVDSVQDILSGKSRATFLAWSNGGARVQSLTSGAKPDTISATFSQEHRVRVSSVGTGSGTVTASVAGDLTAGIYLTAGTPVTLTAAPAAGSIFAGWRDDTTSSALTLNLPMARAYDLEASFIPEVSVTVDDATSEILGAPKLSQAQRQFLDQLGNRNGLFDVGDYLALLTRNGQAVPPALAKALATKAGAKKKGGGR